MTGLSDSFHRPINYLRISVTDRCNLRCVYCMPPEGIALMSHSEILTYEEIYAVAQAAAELGITKVRLTGGEPLARAGLVNLVRMLSAIRGIDDISLTTNGTLLVRHAAELGAAGLRRVNVSLDSLRPERFHQITRWGRLEEVWDGIKAARTAGLNPVKLNMVVMRGINDDEIINFANLTREGEWHVRFIELMPFGDNHGGERLVPISEIERQVRSLGKLEPCLPSKGNGPARYFRLHGAPGTIGFISPVTEHFCIHCNRLRLTADGRLRPCLLSDAEIDLKGPLRRGASREEIKRIIEQAVASKPERHHLSEEMLPKGRAMRQVGG